MKRIEMIFVAANLALHPAGPTARTSDLYNWLLFHTSVQADVRTAYPPLLYREKKESWSVVAVVLLLEDVTLPLTKRDGGGGVPRPRARDPSIFVPLLRFHDNPTLSFRFVSFRRSISPIPSPSTDMRLLFHLFSPFSRLFRSLPLLSFPLSIFFFSCFPCFEQRDEEESCKRSRR